MKKSKSPAFQFYASDWLGSSRVRLMSLEERGAYITLLAIGWDEQGLPDDEVVIARLLDLKPGSPRFRKLWDRVRTAFYLSDGRWRNARQEHIRAEHAFYSEQQSGRAKTRWSKRSRKDATALPPHQSGNAARQCSPTPSSDPPTPRAQKSAGVGEVEPTSVADVVPHSLPPELTEGWRKMLTGEKPVPPRGEFS